MNRIPALLLFMFAVLFTACSKKTVPVAESGKPEESLMIEEIDFDYFQGKARMILKDASKERDVKAVIRVRKDSVIWMNFSVIGVQGGRALINQDSITILNNLDNEYYVFEYTELSKRYNFEINYHVIQSALLGNLLMPRKSDDDVDKKDVTFLLKQTNGTIDVLNFISASTQKIQKVELRENDTHNAMSITYGNFQPVANKLFPYNGTISMLYRSPSGLINTTIMFEYNKAEVGDKELKFPFNIPKKYVGR